MGRPRRQLVKGGNLLDAIKAQPKLGLDAGPRNLAWSSGMASIVQIIAIEGRGETITTQFDGQYLVEYDPFQVVENIIGAHLVTSANPEDAKVFSEVADVWEYVGRSRGTRSWDGKPDRPLTAFSVLITPVSEVAR